MESLNLFVPTLVLNQNSGSTLLPSSLYLVYKLVKTKINQSSILHVFYVMEYCVKIAGLC